MGGQGSRGQHAAGPCGSGGGRRGAAACACGPAAHATSTAHLRDVVRGGDEQEALQRVHHSVSTAAGRRGMGRAGSAAARCRGWQNLPAAWPPQPRRCRHSPRLCAPPHCVAYRTAAPPPLTPAPCASSLAPPPTGSPSAAGSQSRRPRAPAGGMQQRRRQICACMGRRRQRSGAAPSNKLCPRALKRAAGHAGHAQHAQQRTTSGMMSTPNRVKSDTMAV